MPESVDADDRAPWSPHPYTNCEDGLAFDPAVLLAELDTQLMYGWGLHEDFAVGYLDSHASRGAYNPPDIDRARSLIRILTSEKDSTRLPRSTY